MRFGRALREVGSGPTRGAWPTSPRPLPLIDLGAGTTSTSPPRPTLLTRPDQRDDFDRVFARFWPPTTLPLDSGESGPGTRPGPRPPARGRGGRGDGEEAEGAQRFVSAGPASPAEDDRADESRADPRNPATAVMSYSQEEVLRDKNFGDFTDDELARARRLMERMRWQSAAPDPAPQPPPAGRRLDLRRTVRRAFSTGGRPSPGPAGSAS